jgi:hypothetical protein
MIMKKWLMALLLTGAVGIGSGLLAQVDLGKQGSYTTKDGTAIDVTANSDGTHTVVVGGDTTDEATYAIASDDKGGATITITAGGAKGYTYSYAANGTIIIKNSNGVAVKSLPTGSKVTKEIKQIKTALGHH